MCHAHGLESVIRLLMAHSVEISLVVDLEDLRWRYMMGAHQCMMAGDRSTVKLSLRKKMERKKAGRGVLVVMEMEL